MSSIWVGVVFGIGLAAWVYSKLMRSTGGNVSSSLTAAGLSGLLATFVVASLLAVIF